MPSGVLPPAVRRFIGQYLTTIEQLEVLQLLAANMDEAWTAAAVYKSILTNPDSVSRCLEYFTAAGFLEKENESPPAWRWAASGDAAAVIADLCRLYVEMPVRVITAIYEPASAVQEFADAFKFKRQP